MRGFVAGLVLMAMTAAAVVLWPAQAVVPDIQGAVLPSPKPLPEIELADHRGDRVKRAQLRGRWHLVSYGFTHCPDVCPTLLADLAAFQRLLEQQARYHDLQVWFYTVDPQRDSIQALANYVPWFDPRFIGLRATNQAMAERFEESLGIHARISGELGETDYQVSHGFHLFLLDDRARLRAALSPTRTRDGRQFFEPAVLLEDYLAMRDWAAPDA